MQVDLVKSYRIEAAHETPWAGDAKRLHGHSFDIEIVVAGDCDAHLGWLIDYAEITARFEDFYARLDHHCLNEVEGLERPTSEGLAHWIRAGLTPLIEGLKDVRVRRLGDSGFHPQPHEADPRQGLPARIRFGFEAAHALPRLPEGHKCRRMHGHSFLAEVAAEDLTKLQPHLHRVYDRLDHRCLNEIDTLENPTSEEVSRWIWNELASADAAPRAVVVAETCTARCIYHGS